MLVAWHSTWLRRWLTYMVILGTLCAGDARAAHQAHCTSAVNLCRQGGDPTAEPPSCCPEPSTSDRHSATEAPCLVADGCSCCSHAPSGHLGEGDARLPSESSGSDLDLVAVTTAPLIELAAPVPPARAITPADRPLPAARLFLLLGHLRF